MREPSDIELMESLKTGDESAFSELIRRHQQPLLNFFRRMGAHMDKEDLVQETFLRLYRYRGRYQPTAKFTTFLFTLARHVWADRWRKIQRGDRLREAVKQETEGVVHHGGMEQVQYRLDAGHLLERLSDAHREVLVLSLYHSLKYADIAEVLGIPVGTVKSRVFSALQHIREIADEK